MTEEGDLVLVYIEERPAFFARIELITPDIKPDWFHAKMLVLQVPVTVVTWILRRAYIDGGDFTMGGKPVRLVKIVSPEADLEPDISVEQKETPEQEDSPPPSPEPTERGKVVSLADRRRKDHRS